MTTPDQWQTADNDGFPALYRRFDFANFTPVCQLVRALMDLAETRNHHPDIRFGYNYCEVFWTTHSQGGISDLDQQMAKSTDECVAQLD